MFCQSKLVSTDKCDFPHFSHIVNFILALFWLLHHIGLNINKHAQFESKEFRNSCVQILFYFRLLLRSCQLKLSSTDNCEFDHSSDNVNFIFALLWPSQHIV